MQTPSDLRWLGDKVEAGARSGRGLGSDMTAFEFCLILCLANIAGDIKQICESLAIVRDDADEIGKIKVSIHR
jgi:hypothetical protein